MKRKWQRNWKQKLMKKLAPPLLAGMMLLSSYNTVLANPSGGVVTAGAAAISASGSTLTVNQTTNKAAINWQSFGIGRGETVRFIQPSVSSVALNRVVGGNASAIYGTLSANGKVFLINPNGILFAPGSQVNVGGLVASTLNLSDSDFLKGNYSFAKNLAAGSVVNQGTIRTADGGYVAFLGPQVRNEGIIAAQAVGLAAGDKVSLDFDGDKLLSFRVDTQAAGAAATNSGSLLADGGTVVMSTGTKDALLSTVVNNTGLIQARTVNSVSGKIVLEGSAVTNSGTLNASGLAAGQTGGTVKVLGDKVSLTETAVLNASGDAGGGTILVGGAYQGGASEYAATTTTVAAGATLSSDAATTGNGGQVVVWSQDTTRFGGTITARGGSVSGNGGSVETSGKQKLKVADTARVNTTAAKGKTGNWLLDPVDFTVGTNDVDGDITNISLQNALGTNDVTITTTADGTNTVDVNGWGISPEGNYPQNNYYLGENGDIHINAPVNWNSNQNLILSAYRDININAPISGNNGGLTLTAGTGGSGTISAIAGVSVNSFRLKGGSWEQLNASLPTFSVTNFFLTNEDGTPGGSFLRAKGGMGVSGDPYMIADVYGLQGIGSSTALRGKHYKLANNIDAGGTGSWNYQWGTYAGFAPIGGNSASAFSGNFDGGGYTINGLTVNRENGGYAGLFGYASGATIANVGLTGGSITGLDYVGGLVGNMQGGSITNSYSTGNVTARDWYMDTYVGGLVGYMKGGNISGSYATGNVTNTYQNGAYVRNSYAGGLVGYMEGTITGSYATGSVTSRRDMVGGLVGAINGNITDSYATGSVTGANKVGGLVGEQSGGSITNSYAAGFITGTGSDVGGLAGSKTAGAIENSYWDTGTTGKTTSAGGEGKTTAALMKALPTGFDSATWGIITDISYPYLLWRYPTTPQVVSGLVKNAAGAAQAGQTVQTLVNGNLVGSVASGANGFYYMLLNRGSIIANAPVLSYVSGQGSAVTKAAEFNQSLAGFDITAGRVTATSDGALDVTSLLAGNHFSSSAETLYMISGTNNLNVSVSGDLAVTANGIVTQNGALAVTGATTVNAGANNINLANTANDFAGAVTLTGNYVTLRDANALTLGTSTVGGALSITAGGDVTQTGALTVTGATAVNTGANNINLANTANDFTGAASLTGQHVTIKDINALTLGASTVSGDLNITAGGAVTQTGALTVTGATTVNAINGATKYDITLANAANDFTGAVTLIGNNITLTDVNAMTLGAVTAPGSFTLTAVGAITANGAVTTDTFDLKGGAWSQVKESLPTFSATDFRISGGSFLRAKAGSGTDASPYQITDVYGLQGIGSTGLLSKSFLLANNIDASTAGVWNSGAGFKPIGTGDTEVTAFSGNFDGGGHTISGLTINRPTEDYVGLFGSAYKFGYSPEERKIITNVGLDGASIVGKDNVGALAGYTSHTSIANSYVTAGSVTGNSNVGGLVGNAGPIANSYAAANVTGVSNVGGLAGKLPGFVEMSYATGEVTGTGDNVGGLAGYVDTSGAIEKSYASGKVTGKGKVGGLVGSLNAGVGSNGIHDSYATGSVTGTGANASSDYVGGLAGNMNGSGILRSYSTGVVSGANFGGLVGGKNGGIITSSYWNIETSGVTDIRKGVSTTPNMSGVTGLTTEQMKDAGRYSTWDTTIVWYLNGGHTAPLLRSFLTSLTVSADSVTKTYDGNATAALNNVTPYDASKVGGALAWSGKDAGSHGLTGLYTTSQQGYLISYDANSKLTITPKALTAALTGTVEKVYDRTTAATLTDANYSALNGLIDGDAVSLNIATSGSYADKNVNLNGDKAVSVTGLTLTGAAAGNYTLASTLSGNVGKITPKALTATQTAAVSKTYNKTDAAVFNNTNLTLSGLIDDDAVTVSGAGTYDGVDAGSRTITVTGVTLDNGNYSLLNANITGVGSVAGVLTGQISPKALTATQSGIVTKTYNKDAEATFGNTNLTLSGLIDGDAVTVTGAGTYVSVDAGDRTVTVGSVSLDNGNYTLRKTDITSESGAGFLTGRIDRKVLTLTATSAAKIYDGTTSSTATPTSTGLVAGDSLSATQTYGSKNVLGTGGSTLNVSGGYTLTDGNYGNNYTVATQPAIGTITPASLTITATANTKTYDGGMSAAAAPTVTSGTIYNGDAYTLRENYDNKNAGSNKLLIPEITFATASDAANYSVTMVNANTGAINKAALTASLTGAVEKVYDGNTMATLTDANFSVNGKVSGDKVLFTGSGSYDNKNVGTGKNVTVPTYTLDGADGGNYYVPGSINGSVSGVITARPLTASVTAANKVYDGGTAATITGGITLGNFVAGDTVSATYTSGAFADKNVGDHKTVTLSGVTLTGGDAGNYSLAANSIASSASITPATLTIIAKSDSKVYDGTTVSTATPTYTGLIGGDTLGGLEQTYGSKNVLGAGGSTLNVSAYTITDDYNGNNYTVVRQSANGTITPATLTITAATNTKVYDGTTSAAATPTYTGLIGGDTLGGLEQTYGSKNVLGTNGSTLNVSAYTITDGNNGGNYTVVKQTASGTITPASLTITAASATKVYDGMTSAAATPTYAGLKDGDTLGGLVQTYGSKHVLGAGLSTLTVSGGYTLNDGNHGNNYTVATQSAAGTITPATLTAGLTGAVEKVYDGADTATLTGANYTTLAGIVGGDVVSLNIVTSGSYADKNVNVNGDKAVTVTGLSLAGADVGNYQLASTTLNANIGKITPATLTAGLTGTVEKVYDGTSAATLANANYSALSGIVGSDAVYLNHAASGSYANKNAGNGKSVGVNGLSLAGTDAGNYQLASTSLNGNVGKITPASLTITANNASRLIGAENPAFSATYTGLVSSDSAGSLAGTLAFATPATKDSTAGNYAITPSGLISGNYTIAWVDGVLTVNQQTDAYVSAIGSVAGLVAAPPTVPMMTGTGFSGIGSPSPVGGTLGGTTSGTSTGTPSATNAGTNGGTTGGAEPPAASQGSPSSTGTPAPANPASSSPTPTGAAGTGAPIITQVPGLPLTLTGAGINTGGHPVRIAAEQE